MDERRPQSRVVGGVALEVDSLSPVTVRVADGSIKRTYTWRESLKVAAQLPCANFLRPNCQSYRRTCHLFNTESNAA